MDMKVSLQYVYYLKVTKNGQNTGCYNYVYHVFKVLTQKLY